ncbi:hypothetical protein [Streptomyces sp. NPDC051561]|uniref:Rv1733c family protein n=1 Tax=Streptomyces sp. NPDC051561 TaxID=3365658 RepID=UPI0037A80075
MRAADEPVRNGRERPPGTGTASGVWRWRHSPLCRPTDRAEAWVALFAVLVIALAAPVLGLLAGLRADTSLQHQVRLQQQHRHEARGVVLRTLRDQARRADDGAGTGYAGPVSVMARWTAYDGVEHTGRATTVRGAADPGDTFRVWTDDRGRITGRPADTATATTQAALTGFGAAALLAGLAHGSRLLVVRRLTQRRYARLDRAWAKVGPEWGRTGTGG